MKGDMGLTNIVTWVIDFCYIQHVTQGNIRTVTCEIDIS